MRVFRVVWGLTGRVGGRALAGRFALVLVIALWVVASVVGWALIYLPAMPGSFVLASGLVAGDEDGFIDAAYYSWVTQSTLGYGDIAPEDDVLRLLAPLQATLGFGLFTMVVSWGLSIYPALQRQRACASAAHAMRTAYHRLAIPAADIHPTTLARELEQVGQLLHAVRVDYVQYPSTFYFAPPAPTVSVAHAVPFLVALADPDRYPAEVRPAAEQLSASLELFATAIAEQHLGESGDRDDALAAYRRHHGLAADLHDNP